MAGKVGGSKGGPMTDPNVIPFIDILLVLLIIFMVTAPIPTVDIRVDLPPPNPVPIRLEGLNPPSLAFVKRRRAWRSTWTKRRSHSQL